MLTPSFHTYCIYNLWNRLKMLEKILQKDFQRKNLSLFAKAKKAHYDKYWIKDLKE
jgi:hypothetical protein